MYFIFLLCNFVETFLKRNTGAWIFMKHISLFWSDWFSKYVMPFEIWCHLYFLKNVQNTRGGLLLLVACNFTKSVTPPWVFFTFFKFCKWYQIAKIVTYKSCSTSFPETIKRALYPQAI